MDFSEGLFPIRNLAKDCHEKSPVKVLSGKSPRPKFRMNEANIRDMVIVQPLLELGKHCCLRIECHDEALSSDPASEGDRHSSWATASIQDSHPGTHTSAVHQGRSSGDTLDDRILKNPDKGRRAWEKSSAGQEPPACGNYHGKHDSDEHDHENRGHAGDGGYDKLV